MGSENDMVGEWEWKSGGKTPMIVVKWWERSWRRTEGFDDEGDNG